VGSSVSVGSAVGASSGVLVAVSGLPGDVQAVNTNSMVKMGKR